MRISVFIPCMEVGATVMRAPPARLVVGRRPQRTACVEVSHDGPVSVSGPQMARVSAPFSTSLPIPAICPGGPCVVGGERPVRATPLWHN